MGAAAASPARANATGDGRRNVVRRERMTRRIATTAGASVIKPKSNVSDTGRGLPYAERHIASAPHDHPRKASIARPGIHAQTGGGARNEYNMVRHSAQPA